MSLPDSQARNDCLDLSRNVLAVAPAGSGKTGLLSLRMLKALQTVKQPEQVTAITFTNKAAAEIRHRVLTLLQRAERQDEAEDAFDAQCLEMAATTLAHAKAHDWQLTLQPQRIRALTIDGFNARIAAELPLLSSLGGRTGISDDPFSLYEQAVLGLFSSIGSQYMPEALKQAAANWLRFADNRLDQLIGPFAQLLARRDQWLVAVRQGPEYWAKQEEAIIRNIHCQAQQALTEALGPSLCEELAAIAALGAAAHEKLVWARELKSWPATGLEQAEQHIALAGLLVTNSGTLRKPRGITASMGLPAKTEANTRLKAVVEGLEDDTDIERLAANMASLPPAHAPEIQQRLRDDLILLLQYAEAELRVAMSQGGETDYTQIALSAQASLAPEENQFGESLLRRDEQIQHLLVDEMQDTSKSQLDLLRLLTREWMPGDGRSLFMVGDPQQSIYAFRKAEVRLFMEILNNEALQDNVPLHIAPLSANFRSSPELVDWYNRSFEEIFPPKSPNTISYSRSDAFGKPQPNAAVSIQHFAPQAEAEEAKEVIDRVVALKGQSTQSSIAILARSRSHLRAVIAELRRRNIGFSGEDIDALTSLPVVRDLVACAKALWHPQDRLSWAVMLRAPWVGLSWADLVNLSAGKREQSWPERLRTWQEASGLSAEGQQRIKRLLECLDNIGQYPHINARLADRVEALWIQLGGPACIDELQMADAKRTLLLIREYSTGGELTDLAAFERAIKNLYATAASDQLQLMTIHKSKGLEFDHVLLVGCGNKPPSDSKPLLHLHETDHGELLVPRPAEHWSEDDSGAAERLYNFVHEREKAAKSSEILRLLYVAVTRARCTLDIYLRSDTDDEDQLKPAKGSFAELLQPVLTDIQLQAIDEAEQSDAQAVTPRAERITLPFHLPEEEALYRPPELRTVKPSEKVLSAQDDKHLEEEDVYARLVGILYHQSMEKIVLSGSELWKSEEDRHRQSLASGFRRMGMPEPSVNQAVERVLNLVDCTLNGKNGQGLLADKPWKEAEFTLAGYQNSEWISAAIDLSFIDDDNTLWVIDYKTSDQTIADHELTAWLDERKAHYRPQLDSYAALMAEMHTDKIIKSALYFPEWDALVTY